VKEEEKACLGMIHVITGDGKGKTTAALGIGMRAVGRGLKVCMVQFMKGYEYGEIAAAKELEGFDIFQFGRAEFVNKENPEQVDIQEAVKALEHAKKVVSSGKYDIVILDEVNVALDFKLIGLEDVLGLAKGKPKNIELVLTGRNAGQELVELADYVSEVREIKHPYRKGIGARKGIEH
jgi:cob(I)alamin adenosyltransferase